MANHCAFYKRVLLTETMFCKHLFLHPDGDGQVRSRRHRRNGEHRIERHRLLHGHVVIAVANQIRR